MLGSLAADPLSASKSQTGNLQRAAGDSRCDIVIGLINIMPAAAFKSTEYLFKRILRAFSPKYNIHLRLFGPDGNARPGHVQSSRQSHERLECLWKNETDASPIDALIVTGTEPKVASIEDEPSWPHIQKICDWAAVNTISTLWSCFSGHAAVMHMDGIQRYRMEKKLSGIFECERAADHFITMNLPAKWMVPHSRFNGLAEAGLVNKGYRILSQGGRVGVDSFAKHYGRSEFLFLQGHLEYSPQVLYGEYTRDMKRFDSGDSPNAPEIPENYLNGEIEQLLRRLQAAGVSSENLAKSQLVSAVMENFANAWQETAQQMYGDWLDYISIHKKQAEQISVVSNGP